MKVPNHSIAAAETPLSQMERVDPEVQGLTKVLSHPETSSADLSDLTEAVSHLETSDAKLRRASHALDVEGDVEKRMAERARFYQRMQSIFSKTPAPEPVKSGVKSIAHGAAVKWIRKPALTAMERSAAAMNRFEEASGEIRDARDQVKAEWRQIKEKALPPQPTSVEPIVANKHQDHETEQTLQPPRPGSINVRPSKRK